MLIKTKTALPVGAGRGGFHEACEDLWYDLAGRAYQRDDQRYVDHLRVPDYRIVGATLLIGQAPQ